MRIFLLLSLLLLMIHVQSQPALREHKPVMVVNSANDKLSLNLVQEGGGQFVELIGSGWGTVTISDRDEAVLVFTGDSIRLRSDALQSFDYGAARQTYKHRYAIAAEDLPLLNEGRLTMVRKSSFGEWSSIAVPAKGAEAWKSFTATLFPPAAQPEAGVNKAEPRFYTINPEQLAQYKGDSVGFCARVLTADVIDGTTLLQLQYTTGTAQAVIPAASRPLFVAPGGWYAGKDVCVAGVVHFVNNTPQLVLRNSRGLKVTSSLTDADAAYFIGDSITLTGTVSSANYLSSSATKPTLLNTGGAYPNQTLTVVIAQADRAAFGGQPEKDYLAKKILVSGVVTLYKGKPQIQVSKAAQLRLLETPPAPAVVATKPPVVKEPALPPPTTTPVTTAVTVPTSIDIEPAGRREKTADNSQYGEVLATYPGGDAAQQAFLRGRLQCPASAGDETKTVIASFQVENDGAVTTIRIEKSGGKAYDAEVLKALQQMPKWKPRSRNGYTTLDKLYQTFTFYCARRRGA